MIYFPFFIANVVFVVVVDVVVVVVADVVVDVDCVVVVYFLLLSLTVFFIS